MDTARGLVVLVLALAVMAIIESGRTMRRMKGQDGFDLAHYTLASIVMALAIMVIALVFMGGLL